MQNGRHEDEGQGDLCVFPLVFLEQRVELEWISADHLRICRAAQADLTSERRLEVHPAVWQLLFVTSCWTVSSLLERYKTTIQPQYFHFLRRCAALKGWCFEIGLVLLSFTVTYASIYCMCVYCLLSEASRLAFLKDPRLLYEKNKNKLSTKWQLHQ